MGLTTYKINKAIHNVLIYMNKKYVSEEEEYVIESYELQGSEFMHLIHPSYKSNYSESSIYTTMTGYVMNEDDDEVYISVINNLENSEILSIVIQNSDSIVEEFIEVRDNIKIQELINDALIAE